MPGAPLKAAAGQATAVKLQTNRKRPFTIIKGKPLENGGEHTINAQVFIECWTSTAKVIRKW
jgi:hypothetical protein